jgi:phage baseplate assembly protein W
MARNSRTFSDLDLNFIANPVTGDVSRKFDESAIKQSVKNLIMTNHYERLFHPEIGSQVTSLLFEPFSPLLQVTLERAIINTINNYEPRVQVLEVEVRLNEDNYSVYVSITFRIVNTERPLVVDFTLRRTR